eukprot:Skav206294  [mRNA]  locus=scaffold3268:30491:38245:+ [translate_table: standard]
MTTIVRRRATKEELAEGQDEILRAHKRMEKEAKERGELPIEDAKPTPAEEPKEGPGKKEAVRPPEAVPEGRKKQPPRSSPDPKGAASTSYREDTDMGRRSLSEGRLRREIIEKGFPTPAYQEGSQGEGEPVEKGFPTLAYPPNIYQMHTPLFSQEQVQSMLRMQEQSPLLYPKKRESSTLHALARPSFLEYEEARVEADREMLEEARRQMEELMKENYHLKQRLDRVEGRSDDRFSTPDQSDHKKTDLRSKEAETTKEVQTPYQEDADPQKFEGEEEEQEEEQEFEDPQVETPRRVNEVRRNCSRSSTQKEEDQSDTMKVILTLMQGMQEIQRKLLKAPGGEAAEECEVVRQTSDLPKLADWSPETRPIDYNDWLLCLTPQMSDLSQTSQSWWEATLDAARKWYETHMTLSPIARLTHHPVPTPEMNKPKWKRVERRAAALLMTAIPDQLKEEIISSKSVSTLGILAKGMQMYQPGGMTEKMAILNALENPVEATTVAGAVTTLRRWMRWRRRASEVGVTLPDATVLVRGLARLTKKIVLTHADLNFRLSLVRNSLMIDTCPSQDTVARYSENVLAELEQLGQSQKKKEPPPEGNPRLKKFEAPSKPNEPGGWKGRKDEEGRERLKCKFFLTDAGCRKGAECKFSHQDLKDEKRRCWVCGSTDHLSSSCTRRGNSESPKKGKALKIDDKKKEGVNSEEENKEKQGSMKELLEEASKMLRSMTSDTSPSSSTASVREEGEDASRKEMLERLDQRLKAMKTFKVSRMCRGSKLGLIDSGATHALRPMHPNESSTSLRQVDVTLADGTSTPMFMSNGGVMVTPHSDVEPILPMGAMAQKLNCEINWHDGGITIKHPRRGQLPVHMNEGCPQLPRALTLSLIAELEDFNQGTKAKGMQFEGEYNWMIKLINTHPVLKDLPEHVRTSLQVAPGEWTDLPGNKRMRKKWRREGLMVHLYAGKSEGFTLERAFQQQGGDTRLLLEIDKLRDPNQDMLATRTYGGLLRAAVEGKLDLLIGGPNCRTRSVLRHYPIPDQESYPRPVRRWQGEEYGIQDATKEERDKLREDDILLWRMVFLFMLSTYIRQAMGNPNPVGFGLEQPSEPPDFPEVVSLWRTRHWKQIAKEFGLKEVKFNQLHLGGKGHKPTTISTNLDLCPDEHRMRSGGGVVKDSRELSRWSPGTMSMVAKGILKYFGKEPRLRALSWEEHVAFGHIPYRRDCAVCQQTLQQCSPHRRVKHVVGGVLSMDVAGPLVKGKDVEGGKCHYFLVGALTWTIPKGTEKLKQKDESEDEEAPEIEDPEGKEDLPPPIDGKRPRGRPLKMDEDERLMLPEELALKRKEEEEGIEEIPEEMAPGDEIIFPDEEGPQERVEGEGEDEEKEEKPEEPPLEEEKDLKEKEEFETRVFRLALPMSTKNSREVTETAMEMLLALRADGFHVGRIHVDRGHEFAGHFHRWARNRGIYITRTAGDDPRSNGRAEVSVKNIKTQVRKLLRHSGQGADKWPLALRHVNALNRCIRLGKTPDWPTFYEDVIIRKRRWKRDDFSPTMETAKYVCPSPENHGHWVVGQDGLLRLTRSILHKAQEPPTEGKWLALERDALEILRNRRRIRGKQEVTLRSMQMEEDTEKEKDEDEVEAQERNQVFRFIEEEMRTMVDDDYESMICGMRFIGKLKKMITQEESKEEEILQTRLVSVKEVLSEWTDWEEATRNEVESLLQEKQAFKQMTKQEVEDLVKQAKKEGKKVEFLPSKVVWARKPGKNKGVCKVRWVICGNFEEKSSFEDTYSSGADASTYRILLTFASNRQWKGVVLDIKTAFLNAEMKSTPGESIIIVIAPKIFVDQKVLPPDVMYLPLKAVYGLRRSPKLWGDSRDHDLLKMRIKAKINGICKTLKMEPLISEPHLRKIVEDKEEEEECIRKELYGLMMTYVDDIVIVSEEEVLQPAVDEIQKKWKTSTPTRIEEGSTRFLGMEVSMKYCEEKKRDVWYLNQEGFITELLQREGGSFKKKKTPITREQAVVEDMRLTEEKITPEQVREAQRQVGETLWLVTRTRPDLSYAVARMGAAVCKNPKKVEEIYRQILGYLQGTESEGLVFDSDQKEPFLLEVYTDASHAPEGEVSHGGFTVFLGSCPVFWRSTRQAFMTLSTAESELVEAVEGMLGGESIGTVADELDDQLMRILLVDNQAAIAILTQEGGNWRTRHLRMRAAAARQSVARGEWVVRHQSGEFMVADIATKALGSVRFETLKRSLKMGSKEEDLSHSKEAETTKEVQTPNQEDVDPQRLDEVEMKDQRKKDKKNERKGGPGQTTEVMKFVLAAAAISVAKGEPDRDTEEKDNYFEFNILVLFLTVCVIVSTVLIQYLWKHGVHRLYVRFGNQQTADGGSQATAAEDDTGGMEEQEQHEVEHETPQEHTETMLYDHLEEVAREVEIEEQISLEERIEEAIRNIERDEQLLWEEINRTGQLPNGEDMIQGENPFVVLTTRFGSVYHSSHECSYLRAVRTGAARTSNWCHLCMNVAMKTRGRPPRGVIISMHEWGSDFHTSPSCPRARNSRDVSYCTTCHRAV